jgi:CheY-like chemotaxis protein
VKKILLVDDDRDCCYLIKSSIEDLGDFQVRACSEGEKAFSVAELFQPDLIILDYIMPGITGGEVVDQLRRNPKTSAIPVIFMTATSEEQRSAEARNTPALSKPVTIELLISTIKSVLG